MPLNGTDFIIRDTGIPVFDVMDTQEGADRLVGQRRRCTPDEVLYREGEEVRSIYCVRDGLIKLFTHFESGRRRIVRLQRRGDWLGLGGLFARPHLHTAVAVGHTKVDRYPVRRLMGLQRLSPRVQATVLRQWYADLEKADKWIADFSTGGIRVRVARLIGYLALSDITAEPTEVNLLTVQEMGEILGVTPESVSRVVAAYKRDGVLRRRPGEPRELFRVDGARLLRECRDAN
jgi:CRP/FNR family transcriptional regulator